LLTDHTSISVFIHFNKWAFYTLDLYTFIDCKKGNVLLFLRLDS